MARLVRSQSSKPLLDKYKRTLAGFIEGARDFCSRWDDLLMTSTAHPSNNLSEVICGNEGWCDEFHLCPSLVRLADLSCNSALDITSLLLRLKRQPLEVPSTTFGPRRLKICTSTRFGKGFVRTCSFSCSVAHRLDNCLPASPRNAIARTTSKSLDFFSGYKRKYVGEIGSGTRLDEAKKRIEALIDDMQSNDAAMIISFSDHANVVQSYTNNRNLLSENSPHLSRLIELQN